MNAPKTYRVAIIGSTGRGDYGHGLDTAWKSIPRTEVVAVADDNPQGLINAARRLNIDRAFSDYRKMLEDEPADIVAIGPRFVDQHRDMALAALHAGAHVYIEKPFCRSLGEADEIVAACQQRKRKLAVAHPTRYSPMIAAIRGLIRAGELGDVLEYRGRGKEDRRGGGEDLWVLGPHILDMIRAIGGAPTNCFARVSQDGESLRKEHVRPGAEGLGPLAGDSILAVFDMPDRSKAHFASVRNMAGNPRRYGLQILGSKGALEIIEGTLPPVRFLPDPSWSPGRSGKQWLPVSSAGIGKPEPLKGAKYKARHTLAVEDLIDAIENDREPLCGALEARGVVEMIMAVFDSARRGQPVSLPLENRRHPLSLLGAS